MWCLTKKQNVTIILRKATKRIKKIKTNNLQIFPIDVNWYI